MDTKNADHLKGMVESTESMIKSRFSESEGSHDWYHIERVRKTALALAEKEGGDRFEIEMAALLHDLDDWKLICRENETNAMAWLDSLGLEKVTSDHILNIINEVSFKGAGVSTPCSSIESMIVQDADRLDAMGAIGIARAFAYGGKKGNPLHLPGVKQVQHDSFTDYQNHRSTTINHFYEKLLLLKERMNTGAALVIAEERHRFMSEFLKHFFDEWELEI